MNTTKVSTSLNIDPILSPFLLQFLESAHPMASEETGGAETATETGDGATPSKIDSEEDADETGTDDDKD